MKDMPPREYRRLRRRFGDGRRIDWPLVIVFVAGLALWSMMLWRLL
jgi:hypothetical protein